MTAVRDIKQDACFLYALKESKVSLLSVKHLSVVYNMRGAGRILRAVDNVSFSVGRGRSVGLVGESGCGKSTIAHAITGLVRPQCGTISMADRLITGADAADRLWTSRQVQMVFQDPFGSLNPRMTLGACLAEVLHVHGLGQRGESRSDRIRELLNTVGLDFAYASRYPHELSGGQRQRFGIARALAVAPEMLIADEPVSALDVSVQAQILNLLKDIQRSVSLACLFISHDLATVRYMCDELLVMYLGKIVESGPCDAVFDNPSHPYTQSLIEAVPDIERNLRLRVSDEAPLALEGEVSPGISQIQGCPFYPRCPKSASVCERERPPIIDVSMEHRSRCHLAASVHSDG